MNFRDDTDAVKAIEQANLFLEQDEKRLDGYLDEIIQKMDKNILCWLAFDSNHLRIAQLLIEKGADFNITDENGLTPLHIMAVRNYEEGLDLLLALGADPNIGLANGETPLWTAAHAGWNQIVYKLLQAGANPNPTNPTHWTPLLLATALQNHELAFLLLQFNADPNIANNEGLTPIFYSMLFNHIELTQRLLEAGAKTDIKNSDNQSPTEFVAANQQSIHSKYNKPTFYLELYKSPKPIKNHVTKFGGQPVWLEEPTWPLSKINGQPMTFICQVVIEQTLFPHAKGKMAYIFMSDQFKSYDEEGGENAVIIQPGSLPSFIKSSPEKMGPTISEEFNTQYYPASEPFDSQDSMHDYLESLPEEEENAYLNHFARTKMGGTPFYIQDEQLPRRKGWEPLLQINCETIPFNMNIASDAIIYIVINQAGTEGRLYWQCS